MIVRHGTKTNFELTTLERLKAQGYHPSCNSFQGLAEVSS